jgi:hypothetical protein
MLDDTELEGHIDSWIAYEGVLRRDQVSVLSCRIYKAWANNGQVWQWSNSCRGYHGMAAGIEA